MSQLEELRQKTIRPTVPQRTDEFVSSEPTTEELIEVSNQHLAESRSIQTVSSSSTQQGKKRQKGVRLDEEIADSLDRFCLEEKITIETLIEAAWLEMQNNQKLCQKILKSAKKRRQRRFKLGRLQAKKTELAALEAEVAKLID